MQKPDFYYERKYWKRGLIRVAGADEVGRGCFAGPIVAGAVAFEKDFKKLPKEIKIDDSKKLTALERVKAEKWIKENALTWGIGTASVININRFGIVLAARKAFRRAVAEANEKIKARVQFLLVDAFFIPYTKGLPMGRVVKSVKKRVIKGESQMAIVNGDEKSISIAAASIIAKVARDRLMVKLSKVTRYVPYGWSKNKGYGTREHQEAIKKYGVTKHHRKQFVETWLRRSSLT